MLRFTQNSSHGSNEFISRGMQILGLASPVAYRRKGKTEEEYLPYKIKASQPFTYNFTAYAGNFKNDITYRRDLISFLRNYRRECINYFYRIRATNNHVYTYAFN